jgi:hypothetical protein
VCGDDSAKILRAEHKIASRAAEMVVVEFAKSSRAKCHSCSSCIGEGNLKFGTAINNDGYLNMQWHHQGCFWNKRVGKYFRRKGKKINYILKVEQFSNREVLSREENEELIQKVLETNLKHATDAALEKAGIARPDQSAEDVAAGEEEPPKAPPSKKGRKRKAPEDAEATGAEIVVAEPETVVLPSEGRMTRSRAKKLAV